MAGLLYKDFIGIKGRRIVWILTGCTLVFLLLRLLFPGTETTVVPGAMSENEAGEFIEITFGDLRDSLLVMLPMFFIIISCLSLLPAWLTTICRHDEKNKTRDFTRALPLDKKSYIASKYLFIGIAVYLLFSLNTIWITIFNGMAGDNASARCIAVIGQLSGTFYGISLVIASIELPFLITLGVKKGMVIKTAILEGAAFLVMAYLFFGNLKIFENFDITIFVNWCEGHPIIVTLIAILSPVIDLLIFWISYRITCRINQNREVEIDG